MTATQASVKGTLEYFGYGSYSLLPREFNGGYVQ
jgi:hypothetical protein